MQNDINNYFQSAVYYVIIILNVMEVTYEQYRIRKKHTI